MPVRTIAQLKSTPLDVLHHAAVLLPRALPLEWQVNDGARTLMCPVGNVPRAPPNKRTN